MDTGEWRHGLFSGICGADSCGLCMGAWCCYCCLYGRISERLEKFPSEEEPSNCNSPCWLMCGAACLGIHWLPSTLKRQEERAKFGIKGDGFMDCLTSYFCFPCGLAQMEVEVKNRSREAKQNGMGYAQPQGGMVYQQPAPGYQQNGSMHPEKTA